MRDENEGKDERLLFLSCSLVRNYSTSSHEMFQKSASLPWRYVMVM